MKPPCPPKTDCWCETHPNHPDCVPAFPINNTMFAAIILILIVLTLIPNKKK